MNNFSPNDHSNVFHPWWLLDRVLEEVGAARQADRLLRVPLKGAFTEPMKDEVRDSMRDQKIRGKL